MKKTLIIVIFIIGLNLVFSLSELSPSSLNINKNVSGKFFENSSKVSSAILNQFDNNEKVKVVIKLKDSIVSAKINTYKGFYTKEITKKELEDLENDNSVEGIYSSVKISAFLQDSVPLIGADSSWGLQDNAINLTGLSETVCIIDTGINFSHPDLIGKNASCNVDCFNKIGASPCIENCSLGDDNGHGTHVAGIVSASGGIYGIAPDTKLIGIKVLDSSGWGSDELSDISKAIDWCVLKNASVISMSLGTDSDYDSACDSVGIFSPWKNSINIAISKNISVVAASGNNATSSYISSPACLSNVIPVGATNKTDSIAGYSSRNSLVKLFAPGTNINSTETQGKPICSEYPCIGNYATVSGTSMSTPMVAGAIAIINQLLKLEGKTMTPKQIENTLWLTGKSITEGENNFSRIKIFDAILSIDEVAPTVNLTSPVDEEINSEQNKTFTCNFSDWQLSNATLKIWNSTDLFLQEIESKTGTSNESEFNVTNLPLGNYEWNCLVVDAKNNYNSASTNFTFTVGGIHASLYTPENDTYTNSNETIFSCGGESESKYELKNLTFYLWNNSTKIYNESKELSFFSNSTNFTHNFSVEGNYKWGCVVTNNNSDFSAENYTIHFDQTSPIISNLETIPSTSSVEINWDTNELSNSSSTIGGNSSTLTFDHSITISSLSSSTTYNFEITSCDVAGNCATNSSSFTTLSPPSSSSSSSSVESPSLVPSSSTSIVSEKITSEGKSEEVRINQKIIFDIGDGVNRSLILAKTEDETALILIEPNGIFLNITLGASEKINLSSADYYDLMIKLENISDKKANISLYKIYEPINKEDGKVFAMGNSVSSSDNTQKLSKSLVLFLLSIFLLVAISIFVLAIILISKIRKENHENKKT